MNVPNQQKKAFVCLATLNKTTKQKNYECNYMEIKRIYLGNSLSPAC